MRLEWHGKAITGVVEAFFFNSHCTDPNYWSSSHGSVSTYLTQGSEKAKERYTNMERKEQTERKGKKRKTGRKGMREEIVEHQKRIQYQCYVLHC